MNLIKYIRSAFKKAIEQRKAELRLKRYAAAYGLYDTAEQYRIITEHNLIQEKKSTLSKRNRDLIEDKVSFMIQNKIIKVQF